MNPIVSVIIPSYNHEKFVKECIESVLDQTFQDFEIVVTDDGSTDRTVEIIKTFQDPRIKLFVHTENRGACIAANNCIKHSKGKYIAMLSSDDAWYPKKLAKQVQYLDDHPNIAAVFGNVDWIDENSNLINSEGFPFKDIFDVKNRSRYEWLNHFFTVGNCLCHPCSLIRKESYLDVGLLNPSFANLPDFDLWVRLCLKYDITILEERLIRYRWMSDNSNASSDSHPTHIRVRFEYKQILNHYVQIKNSDELLAIFPNVLKYGKLTSETIPYFLGRIAIDSDLDFKVGWGQETIFSLLQDEKIAQTLVENCNFTYLDFINLTKENDPYHRELLWELSTQLVEKEQTVKALSVQIAKKDQIAEMLATQITEIRNSDTWKLTVLLQRICIFLAPPESQRARVLRQFTRFLFLPTIKIRENRRIKKDLALIQSSGLFDEKWYLVQNPDVAEAEIDPIRHYLLFGGFEGRDPSPYFSSGWYLNTYNDVKIAGINPLVHFLKAGVSERRAAHPDQNTP